MQTTSMSRSSLQPARSAVDTLSHTQAGHIIVAFLAHCNSTNMVPGDNIASCRCWCSMNTAFTTSIDQCHKVQSEIVVRPFAHMLQQTK